MDKVSEYQPDKADEISKRQSHCGLVTQITLLETDLIKSLGLSLFPSIPPSSSVMCIETSIISLCRSQGHVNLGYGPKSGVTVIYSLLCVSGESYLMGLGPSAAKSSSSSLISLDMDRGSLSSLASAANSSTSPSALSPLAAALRVCSHDAIFAVQIKSGANHPVLTCANHEYVHVGDCSV